MESKKEVSKRDLTPPVQCDLGVLCSLSSIDSERNNISLFNVIEQLNPVGNFFLEQKKINKPLLLPIECEVVLLWRRLHDADIFDDEINTDFKLKFIDPFGKVLQETLSPLKIQKQKKRTRFRVRMNALPLTVPGNYKFRRCKREKDFYTEWAGVLPRRDQ